MNWAAIATLAAKCLPSSTYILVGVLCFTGGYYVATEEAKQKEAERELAHAVALADQGKRDYEKIIRAQNTADQLRATGDGYLRELDRVRKQLAARKTRASADSCADERTAVAKCERLLQEGVDLLGEGAGLLRNNAAVHDGVLTLLSP